MRQKVLVLAGSLVFAGGHAFAQGNVTEERVLAESGAGDNWFLKGGNFRGEHFSPLDEINDKNIGDLGLAWSIDLPVPDGIAGTPIVVDGVIYLSGAYSVVFAIDASSGDVLWTYDPDVRGRQADDPGLSWPARANRGVAVWHDKVFVTTADCWLHALDAGTGREVWSKLSCDPKKDYAITDSPYVGGNKVFVGNAGSESEMKNRGYVSAYDQASGDLLWRFFIVPSDDPEENDTAALRMAAKTWSGDTLEKYGGGGHSWNEMTYDPGSGLLFFGTSGAYPYIHEWRSPGGGDNLFLSSIVAVNADSGEYVWHYQTVPADSWDYNATMNIVLADLEIDGEDRQTVLVAPKNGFHYALDRLTGELLTAGKFAKTNWASQINMETGRPVMDPAGEYWNIEGEQTAVVWPNMWGAHSWNPMAYHPGLGLSYVPVVDMPSVFKSDGEGDFDDDNVVFTEVDGVAHSPGKLVAFDPAAPGIRWTVDHPLPFNGGVMATAGNLVFQGNAEGDFVAYAADSGERLWAVRTGSAINAAPSSYKVDEQQHVLIPIGSGGGLQYVYPQMHVTENSKGPTRLLAFSLDGNASLPEITDTRRPLPEQPELDATTATIENGKELYSGYCKFCHGFAGVARAGGTVPDLRYSSTEIHETWNDIVIGGAKRANGMPSFDLDLEDAQAIRAYLLSLSQQLRRGRTSTTR
jgi:quinohemoprotein ethanol dehydrogenase